MGLTQRFSTTKTILVLRRTNALRGESVLRWCRRRVVDGESLVCVRSVNVESVHEPFPVGKTGGRRSPEPLTAKVERSETYLLFGRHFFVVTHGSRVGTVDGIASRRHTTKSRAPRETYTTNFTATPQVVDTSYLLTFTSKPSVRPSHPPAREVFPFTPLVSRSRGPDLGLLYEALFLQRSLSIAMSSCDRPSKTLTLLPPPPHRPPSPHRPLFSFFHEFFLGFLMTL